MQLAHPSFTRRARASLTGPPGGTLNWSFPESLEIQSLDKLLDRSYSVEHVLDSKAPGSRRHGPLLSGSDHGAEA